MKRGIINRERGDILDIRVDNMQQVNATPQTQQAQQSGEDFKFTLMSSIEEAGLSER